MTPGTAKRILITGSRNWVDTGTVEHALSPTRDYFRWPWPLALTIVHGGAVGADALADLHARKYGYAVEVWRPDYNKYPGHLAPLRRNDAMLDSGIDLVIAFRLGTPARGGTQYTIDGAMRRGLPVVIYSWPGDPGYVTG